MQDDSDSKFQVEYVNGKTTLSHVPAQIEFSGTNVKVVLGESSEVLFDVPVSQVKKSPVWGKPGSQLSYIVNGKTYNFIPKLSNENAIDKKMTGGGAKGSTYSKTQGRLALVLFIVVVVVIVVITIHKHK